MLRRVLGGHSLRDDPRSWRATHAAPIGSLDSSCMLRSLQAEKVDADY
jgi:hypothetical protein